MITARRMRRSIEAAPTTPLGPRVQRQPRPAPGTVALRAEGLTVHAGGAVLLDGVNIEVRSGSLLALVGPNGAGKSTLLAALAGDALASPAGRSGKASAARAVRYGDAPLGSLSPGELARRRAVMPQQHSIAFPFTVEEVVTMGRAPWHGSSAAAEDEAIVAWALETTGTAALRERAVTTLSGGERARVVLARTLAQDAPVVLLDEPTAALDPPQQERALALLAERAAAGDAVVVAVHDLTAAAAHADRIALLSGGRLLAVGAPEEVLTPALLEQAYGHPMEVLTEASGGRRIVLPAPVDRA